MFTLGRIEPGQRFIVVDKRENARKPLNELADFTRRAELIPADGCASPCAEGAPAPSSLSVVDIPLHLVNVAKDLFQNRKKDYSARSVENIVNAVKNGTFRWENFDPVILWEEPVTGKFYILSGHSRTEAFRRLAAEGAVYDGRPFDYIPAKISRVSLEEAKEIAKKSNTLSTKETDTERAAYYREKREAGASEKELRDEAKVTEGKDADKILSLSFLNPSGRVIAALESTDEADQTTKNTVQTVAAWIGSARRSFPALTDEHENELFDWLIYGGGYGTRPGQISNADTFREKVGTLVMRNTEFGEFKADRPLNPRNLQKRGPYELEYEQQMKEAQRALIDLKKRAADVYAAEAAQSSLFGLGSEKASVKTVIKNRLAEHLAACAASVLEMIRLGIPMDTALNTVKKESGLSAQAWRAVVAIVQKRMTFTAPGKMNFGPFSLNGLGNPAYLEAAKITAQVLGPVILENAVKYMEQKRKEKETVKLGSVEVLNMNAAAAFRHGFAKAYQCLPLRPLL